MVVREIKCSFILRLVIGSPLVAVRVVSVNTLRKRGLEVAGFALHYCVRAAAARTRQRRQYGEHAHPTSQRPPRCACATTRANLNSKTKSSPHVCVPINTPNRLVEIRFCPSYIASVGVYTHVVVKGYNYEEEVDLRC